jgi:predicted O-methyltransferase YrrM
MIEMLSGSQKLLFEKFISPLADKGILLETGTGYGESSCFFSSLKPHWTIYTVDAFGLYGDGRIYNEWNTEKVKTVNEKLLACGNVIQLLGDSSKIPWQLPIDVLYIDADHTKEGCKADYDCYAPYVKSGGLIIFDDYEKHNSINGVSEFVDELQGLKLLHKDRMAIFRKPAGYKSVTKHLTAMNFL